MAENIIVDDLKFITNPKTIEMLKELSQYEPQKHTDDIKMLNYIHITSLWRRMKDGKDVCLGVKVIK